MSTGQEPQDRQAEAAAYRAANKETLAAKAKVYRKANRTAILEYQREWRQQNVQSVRASTERWRAKNPDKNKAHRTVADAILLGKLVTPTACETCGEDKPLVAHHDDYLKRLDVRWLCNGCHNTHHREMGAASNG